MPKLKLPMSLTQQTTSGKVAVAMSGGVDSSVAAAILVQEGYEVIGVTMEVRPAETPIEEQFSETCTSLSAVRDAHRVADRLGIPHHAVDFRELFRKTIVSDFIEEYRRGRTPNPCVRCNRLVKFGALMELAKDLGAEYLATGHYVRIMHDKSRDRWILKRGLDSSKDQSYALYALTQNQLSQTLMPLGNMAKDETRRLAEELGLAVASKPESQEICFVDGRDYPGFLRREAPELATPGPILDTRGKEIGEHQGIAFYTVGQRKRLGIAVGEPLYVVEIDLSRNAVIVGKNEDLYASTLTATNWNSISVGKVADEFAVTAKVRYNMKDSAGGLTALGDGRVQMTFDRPQRAICPGQALVCYDGEDVVGGGTIERVIRER